MAPFFYGWGSTASSHFEETVYFLPLRIEKYFQSIQNYLLEAFFSTLPNHINYLHPNI